MNRFTLFTLGVLALTAAFCSRKADLPPLHPEKLFAETEAAIQNEYIFSDDEKADMKNLYRAAILTLGASTGGEDRKTLVEKINALPEEKRRAASYEALRAMLHALPMGDNEFARAEGLALLKDPERSAGIGLVIRADGPGRFYAVDAFEGSAAAKAGVKTGKYLKKIDGHDVSGMDFDEVIGRIRGPAGDKVEVTFDDATYSLKRGPVEMQNIQSATWSTKSGGSVEIVILRAVVSGMTERLKGFLSRMGTREAVVLDLRKLHPGEIEEAFKLADLFVTQGRMGGVKLRRSPEQNFNADADAIYRGKLYVIVGQNSSPVARTLAMALTASPQTAVVGPELPSRAFVTRSLPVDGGIELRLTTGYVVDPKGEPFHKTGLKSNLIVADYVPNSTLNTRPDQADPAHVKIAAEMGVE